MSGDIENLLAAMKTNFLANSESSNTGETEKLGKINRSDQIKNKNNRQETKSQTRDFRNKTLDARLSRTPPGKRVIISKVLGRNLSSANSSRYY